MMLPPEDTHGWQITGTPQFSISWYVGLDLVIDGTGVGKAVVDMFRENGTIERIVPVSITAGIAANFDGNASAWRVPKKDLVSVLQVLMQSGRPTVARELDLAEVLIKELLNFKVKITTVRRRTQTLNQIHKILRRRNLEWERPTKTFQTERKHGVRPPETRRPERLPSGKQIHEGGRNTAAHSALLPICCGPIARSNFLACVTCCGPTDLVGGRNKHGNRGNYCFSGKDQNESPLHRRHG